MNTNQIIKIDTKRPILFNSQKYLTVRFNTCDEPCLVETGLYKHPQEVKVVNTDSNGLTNIIFEIENNLYHVFCSTKDNNVVEYSLCKV